MATLCAAILAIMLLPTWEVAAHGLMIEPRSRAWLGYLEKYDYNPWGYANRPDINSAQGKLTWPASTRNSICGDPNNETRWDSPGRITGRYKSGQTITIDSLYAQNHLGRQIMRICPLNAKKDSECRALERADGKGNYWDLPWTSNEWAGVTSGYVPPKYKDGFYQLYKLPPINKTNGCTAWACDQFKGMYVYRTQWKLPRGFKCSHCKLQWFYLTGSRCWPPCVEARCKKPMIYKYCNERGATYPEEFWNCADIRVQ